MPRLGVSARQMWIFRRFSPHRRERRHTERDSAGREYQRHVVAGGAWPVIAIHAVLLPDGRVLSYGTDGTGKQTGFFTYDVWDSAAGLGGAAT